MTEEIQGSLDRDRVRLDLEQLIRRLEVLVDEARRLDVPLTERADHSLHLRPDDVRVDADPADSPELEKREDEIVVPGIEVKVGLPDDAARLDEVVIRLLDSADGRDLGQLDDRLGLDVDDHAAGDVVDDDRPVADVGDRAEVLHDSSGRRLVVIRSDDEETVYTELVRFTRQVDGVSGGVGTGAGDHRAVPVERVDGDPKELEALVVRERGALAGGARD